MKVYTLTWYRGNNYGSVLQAYALPVFIRSLGYECENIAYQPDRLTQWKLKFINHSIKETIEYKINEWFMRRKGQGFGRVTNNLELFDDFRRDKMIITNKCSSAQDILSFCDRSSVFVCGSDQVWNPYFYDPVYYLEFVEDKKKKIAYAPSFGVEHLPKYAVNRIKNALLRFGEISVREQQGVQIVEELTGKHSSTAVDPTLLLSVREWDDLAILPNEVEPYIFCYFLSNNTEYYEIAKKMSAKYGLKIVMLPMVAADFLKRETINEPVGPQEWLGLMKNAELILTDSFHCTLFAIRYHKQFYVFQRFSSTDKRGQNSRINSLLELVSLQERLIVSGSSYSQKRISGDSFAEADRKLKEKIEGSKKWLGAALKRAE